MRAFGQRLLSFARRPLPAIALLLALLMLALAGRHFYFGWQFAQHLQSAQRAEECFDFNKAREHLAECLRIRPQDPETRLLLGRNARRLGDYVAAQAELDAYRDLTGSPTSESALEAAMLLAQQGDLLSAENFLCQRLQQDDPQTPLIVEALVRGGIRVYRLQDSLLWADQLLTYQPDNVPAFPARGMIHESIGHAAWPKPRRTNIELSPRRLPHESATFPRLVPGRGGLLFGRRPCRGANRRAVSRSPY